MDHAPARKSWIRNALEDLGSCLLVAVILTVLFTPFTGAGPRQALIVLIYNLIITLGIGLSVANLYRHLFPRLVDLGSGRLWRLIAHVLVAGPGLVGGSELSLRVIQLLGGPHPSVLRPNVLRVGLVVVLVVLSVSIAFERLRDHARRVELRAESTQRQMLRAQLDVLRAQTNPHFLFNSLNTVAALIEEDPAAAERAIEHLSRLLRYSLEGSRRSWVRLGEELRAVQDYLNMETLRFGKRLRARVEALPAARDVLVPPLILQPLVENAVLHGVAGRPGGGSILVSARLEEQRLTVDVIDDGPGPGSSTHEGTGTGLESLAERLRLSYGEGARLETGAGQDGRGFRARCVLPAAVPAGAS